MERRGESVVQEYLYFIVRLLLLIIVVVIILAIFNMFVTKEYDILEEEAFIVSQRLIRSSNCLAYEEDGRIFQGIIDVDKFELSRINSCLVLKENYGLNVSLSEIDGENYGSFIPNFEATTFVSLCDVKNPKGFSCVITKHYVLIKKEDGLKPGYIDLMVAKGE